MKANRVNRRLLCACALGVALSATTYNQAAGQAPIDDRWLPTPDSVREERNVTDPLQALQWERVDALRRVVELSKIQFDSGTILVEDLTGPMTSLLEAELDVISNAEERIAICQHLVEAFREVEEAVDNRVQQGDLATVDLLGTRATRLHAAIQLLREQLAANEVASPNPAVAAEEHDFSVALQALQRERVDTLREFVKYVDVQFAAGTIQSADLTRALCDLQSAELELAVDAEQRIAICHRHLESIRSVDEMVELRHQAGELSVDKVFEIHVVRLQAEIDLLRAQLAEQTAANDDPPLNPSVNEDVNEGMDPILALQRERIDTLRESVELLRELLAFGAIQRGTVMRAMCDLLEAELELSTESEERIALCQRLVEICRQFDERAMILWRFAETSESDALQCVADRLAAEIQLLREQTAASAASVSEEQESDCPNSSCNRNGCSMGIVIVSNCRCRSALAPCRDPGRHRRHFRHYARHRH